MSNISACRSTLNLKYFREGLELKYFLTYSMIKARQSFIINFRRNFDFDAKIVEWVGQKRIVRMTLSTGKIVM